MLNTFISAYKTYAPFTQEYPTKPLRKKTALRGVFDLAGKTKTRRMSWLEYDYNRVWLTENEKQCSWLIKQGQVFFFWLNFVLFRFLTLT